MTDDDPARGTETPYDTSKTSSIEMWAQKRRLADAMRTVIDRLVASAAPEEELRAAAEALERYAERLASHPRLPRFMGYAEAANSGDVLAFFDQSPLMGLANPLAPPITMARTGPRSVVGIATFGSAYEGPPSSVHGGYVAAAFDEVLGFAQSTSGRGGMTGTLTVRCRRPTPLHRELRIEAELTRTEGRKIFCHGRILAGEETTAEAEGIFVTVPLERMEALRERRDAYERSLERGRGSGNP